MNRDEAGLLRAILREGLLTESQGRRVARAISHGASMEEALGRTPLIDPLDYQKLLRTNSPQAPVTPEASMSIPESDVFEGLDRIATYDLAEHEDIPLVQRLYELLGEVFYGGLSGLEIGREEMQRAWTRVYDTGGRCLDQRTLEAPQAEKMIARLRVMGRLSPSKREFQKCLMGLKGNGLEGAMLLESEGDVVRLKFARRTTG